MGLFSIVGLPQLEERYFAQLCARQIIKQCSAIFITGLDSTKENVQAVTIWAIVGVFCLVVVAGWTQSIITHYKMLKLPLALYTVRACFDFSVWVVLRLNMGGDGNCLDGETSAVMRVIGELSSTPEGFTDCRWISSTLSHLRLYCTVTLKETMKKKENIRILGKLFTWGMVLF